MVEQPEERPAVAAVRRQRRRTHSDSQDAHELQEIRTQYDRNTATVQRSNSLASSRSKLGPPRHIYWIWDEVKKVWRRHIVLVVDQVDTRDHLANERTFLTYLKTSQGLSLLGIIIAQVFRIQHSYYPDPQFGYHAVGKPLGAICQGGAILILLLGLHRWYCYQHAMIRGRALTGGFEITTVWMGLLAFLITLLALTIAIAIRRDAT